VQKPAAVSSPDFFPAEKFATHPPTAEQQNNDEEIFIEDEFFPYKQEVTRTDPSNFKATRATQQRPRRRTFSLSSSVYGNSPEASAFDPSPAEQPTYAQITTCPHQRLSSSSSTASHHSLPSDSVAAHTRSRSRSLTPERPKIYMPQISFDPLPVLKEGEGLEENENLAISIVDGHNSWTVVQRKKKNKKKKDSLSEKWTKQQRQNFERFGDIWYQEPYENYHFSDFATPAAAAPLPQAQIQQQPVLQKQPAGQPQPPVLPPQQPIVVPPQLLPPQPIQVAPLQPPQNAQPPIPKIIITPPPPQCTPKMQKQRLEAIPEDDEATGSQRPKIEAEDISPAQGALGGGLSQTMEQLGRGRREDLDRSTDEQLREVLERLNLSPEEMKPLLTSPPLSGDEGASPVFQSALSSPKTPKPAPLSPQGAAAGPPSQRRRQMEKDFANTQYKRLLEAEALEKKKKKELAKEKVAQAKQESELSKAVYHRLLEAEKTEKKVKKEIKKEKP
jgi:hypothetical protein